MLAPALPQKPPHEYGSQTLETARLPRSLLCCPETMFFGRQHWRERFGNLAHTSVSEIAKRGLLLLLLKTATREIVGSLADHTVTHPLARRTLRQLPAISCATVLNL